jgi:hypothetical protein
MKNNLTLGLLAILVLTNAIQLNIANASILAGAQISFRTEQKTEDKGSSTIGIPFGFLFGYYSPEARILGSYERSRTIESESEVSVDNTHNELLMLIQYAPFASKSLWIPHLTIGGGGMWDEILTSAAGIDETQQSSIEAIGYTGVGVLAPFGNTSVFFGADIGMYFANQFESYTQAAAKVNFNLVF